MNVVECAMDKTAEEISPQSHGIISAIQTQSACSSFWRASEETPARLFLFCDTMQLLWIDPVVRTFERSSVRSIHVVARKSHTHTLVGIKSNVVEKPTAFYEGRCRLLMGTYIIICVEPARHATPFGVFVCANDGCGR